MYDDPDYPTGEKFVSNTNALCFDPKKLNPGEEEEEFIEVSRY
jgi:hypothetical protein